MIRDVVSRLVADGFGPELISRGFKLQRSLDFVRKVGPCRQHLGVVFIPVRGQPCGGLQVCPGFLFNDVEDLAAELEGVPRRKGWPTVSANIGNLRYPPKYLEWPVSLDTDIEGMGQVIAGLVREVAVPFWDRFATLDGLLEGYRANDHRLLLSGSGYRWTYAAVCCLTGHSDEARQMLSQWQTSRPAEAVIARALERIGKRG